MTLQNYKTEVLEEFFNLMEFWTEHAAREGANTGFHSSIANDNSTLQGPRSTVAMGRIAWGFSQAVHFVRSRPELATYEHLTKEWIGLANRAAGHLITQHWDIEHKGVFWNVDNEGIPLEKKKQLYAHSFFIYGLSEASKVLPKKSKALPLAQTCFKTIIEKAYDSVNGGYIEGFAEDWSETDDYILSNGKDRKSMNTHLHLLECFANLYTVDKSPQVHFHLKHCLEIMLDKVIGAGNTRMTLFFTQDWKPTTDVISYGHDIEASWLMLESAEILGDESLVKRCQSLASKMARDTIEGLRDNGGMVYEKEPATGHINENYSWWVIAESMVGYLNAYQLSGKVHYLEKSQAAWSFAKKHLIDYKNGEWFSGVDENVKLNSTSKANPWKAPYHNVRACIEVYKRLSDH